MEVMHCPGLINAPQHAGLYHQQTMPQMYTPNTNMHACYSFHVGAPSRAQNTDHHNFSYHHHHNSNNYNAFDTNGHGTTHTTSLQSVLRGEIPHSYTRLPHSSQFSSQTQSSKSFYASHSSPPHPTPSIDISNMYSALSPSPSFHSSSSYSPRPSSIDSHTSQDSLADLQTEPMDLSYKKPLGKRKASFAFLDSTPSNPRSSKLPSTKLKQPKHSSSEFTSTTTTNSTSTPSSMHRFPPSPVDSNIEEFSLLRNLLSVGKQHNPLLSSKKRNHLSPNPNSDYESNHSDSFLKTPLTGNSQPVQLAKKNLFPVSARVSDWLVKIVQFARSIPEFSALSHNDKITLILNSWSRIMLLYMAESNFQFAVTPAPASKTPEGRSGLPQEEPTMKAVEGMQTFIKKCQRMAVDSKEYDFFRMLVLFNSGYPGLSCPETIDQLSSVVQQLLQQHVKVTRPRNLMHYSRLLMCLPCLYSTNGKMFENLFCKHINKTTDMELLLKEILQNIP